MSLFFFDVNYLEVSMISVMFASIGFWSSLVFYNAFLPEINSKSSNRELPSFSNYASKERNLFSAQKADNFRNNSSYGSISPRKI